MADEATIGEKSDETTPEAPAPATKETNGGDSLDRNDDIFDLLTDDDKIDEALALLSASLGDVDIMELLEQVREM